MSEITECIGRLVSVVSLVRILLGHSLWTYINLRGFSKIPPRKETVSDITKIGQSVGTFVAFTETADSDAG